MKFVTFLWESFRRIVTKRSYNAYVHNQIENEIARINIKRIVPVSCFLILTAIIVFAFNIFNHSFEAPMLYFYIAELAILLFALHSFYIAYLVENKKIKIGLVRYYCFIYWFLMTTLVAFIYLLDAHLTGSMYSIIAFFIFLSTIPILKLKEFIAIISIPNLMVVGFTAFNLLAIREYTYTIIIYNLLAIVISISFYMSIYKSVETEKHFQEANKKLEIIAVTDPLTGVLNRLGFDQVFKKVRFSTNPPKSVSVISIDIDYFKAYNDAFGHQKGDECLMIIALTLNLVFNHHSEAIARTGGEEFAILLCDKSEEELISLTKLLMEEIEALDIDSGNKTISERITVSCGIATIEFSRICSWNDLYERSDSALYQAKNSGRNNVVIYQEVLYP